MIDKLLTSLLLGDFHLGNKHVTSLCMVYVHKLLNLFTLQGYIVRTLSVNQFKQHSDYCLMFEKESATSAVTFVNINTDLLMICTLFSQRS